MRYMQNWIPVNVIEPFGNVGINFDKSNSSNINYINNNINTDNNFSPDIMMPNSSIIPGIIEVRAEPMQDNISPVQEDENLTKANTNSELEELQLELEQDIHDVADQSSEEPYCNVSEPQPGNSGNCNINLTLPFCCTITVPANLSVSTGPSSPPNTSVVFDTSCLKCIIDEFVTTVPSIPNPSGGPPFTNVPLTFHRIRAVGSINYTSSIKASNPENNSSAYFSCQDSTCVDNVICLSPTPLVCPSFNNITVSGLSVSYSGTACSGTKKIYTISGNFNFPGCQGTGAA